MQEAEGKIPLRLLSDQTDDQVQAQKALVSLVAQAPLTTP